LVASEMCFRYAEFRSLEFRRDETNQMKTESGPATVRRILGAYAIGAKIRGLRLAKRLGLVELGRHCGLSASMLSQLENGRLTPTLPTLARIAMVFDVGLDHFFVDPDRSSAFHVVRAGERMRFPSNPDDPDPAWQFECLAFPAQEKSMQAYVAHFEPRADVPAAHSHDDAELLYVLAGPLVVVHAGRVELLGAGDSAYFDGSIPHSYRAPGPGPARAVVVTTPSRS
jgi:transcriptional regulator with XRE-family HTH domain